MKLKINDLVEELMELYYGESTWDEGDLSLLGTYTKFDKETGTEIGADLVVSPPVVATYITAYTEDMAQELGDNLCNAALFIQEEDEYEMDFRLQELEPIKYTHSEFITIEQRTANTNYYMNAIEKCNNFSKLRTIRESVLAGQKGTNGSYFFLTGEAKKFWAAYNTKKEQLNSVIKIKKTLRAA